ALEATFRLAFLSTWCRVPEPDRQRLLSYWWGRRDRLGTAGPSLPPQPRPRIQVIDVASALPVPAACQQLGHELSFAVSFVAEQPHDLPAGTARPCVEVPLYAPRRRWRLVEEVFERPLDRWEARHGKRATEAARLAKQAAVEQAFLRAYETEVGRVLSDWGFP